MASQATGKQHRQQCAVSLALELFRVRGLPECDALFGRQPVAQAHTQISDSFDAANARSQVGTQQTRVGCLISETPYGTQTQVDGSGSKQPRLEKVAIAENHGLV